MPGDHRDELRRLLHDAHAQLLERDREIDSLGTRLAARVDGMRDLRRQLRRGERDLARTNEQLEQLRGQLRQAEQAKARTRERLVAIESSRAWRLLRLLARVGRARA